MLTQYLDYKSRCVDALLFFQVGDFYETFFEDALTVSRALNLTLTSRDKNNAEPVPMCGVPIAVIDTYVDRLVAQGFSAALVSQGEIVAGQKGMVPRKLDRIVTPGIKVLSGAETNRTEAAVAAVFLTSENEAAIALSDVQSGKILVRDGLTIATMLDELSRLSPSEVVLPIFQDQTKLDGRISWIKTFKLMLPGVSIKYRSLPSHDSLNRDLAAISGYSAVAATARKAVRLLITYTDETTVEQRLTFTEIITAAPETTVGIDATTRKALELVRTARSETVSGSLLGFMDRTVTSCGARLIRRWILAPSTDIKVIAARHDAVSWLLSFDDLRSQVRDLLKLIIDFERVGARCDLGIVTPRELEALRESLDKLLSIKQVFNSPDFEAPPGLLLELLSKLNISPQLLKLLNETLEPNPTFSINDGGVIRVGFSEELDRLRELRQNGKNWIAQLETKERERSGIGSLKIRYNNVIGYYFELTKSNLSRIPDHFIRRQATVSGERFTTEELKALEQDVMSAQGKQIALEKQIFDELRAKLKPFADELRALAVIVASIDVLNCLADLAQSEDLRLPQMDESADLVIERGRHPVLAQMIQQDFVANDIDLNHSSNFLVITGPNMGGKSTYLRQAALIVIMAQIGSFVPAKFARIGIVDRIFARIGASDDLTEGESTFMVEMREASAIIGHATNRSLVLIDEIGRGTATADGLSIAQAILEWIITKIKCRTLFATHFHELTSIDQLYPAISNVSVGSVDRDGEVVFTHEIKDGPASKSYGIEVAKLAGLPVGLLSRARQLQQENADTKEQAGNAAGPARQLSFFDPSREVIKEPEDYALLKGLAKSVQELDLNETTPIEALNFLHGLKSKHR
jgi:DNA mismatch repair protein MutS